MYSTNLLLRKTANTTGYGEADALANTQKEFRNSKEYSHLNVWAAFQLSGDWRPIDF